MNAVKIISAFLVLALCVYFTEAQQNRRCTRVRTEFKRERSCLRPTGYKTEKDDGKIRTDCRCLGLFVRECVSCKYEEATTTTTEAATTEGSTTAGSGETTTAETVGTTESGSTTASSGNTGSAGTTGGSTSSSGSTTVGSASSAGSDSTDAPPAQGSTAVSGSGTSPTEISIDSTTSA